MKTNQSTTDLFSHVTQTQQSCLSPVMTSAIISNCGKYRYSLQRQWDEAKPMIMFLMLNPSTADENKDDATIRRCIRFAKDWGFGALCVGNLFAFRSTDPKKLLQCDDPIGLENKWYIDLMAELSETIVCAWGNSPIVSKLGKKFGEDWKPLKGIGELHYIELSKDGTPKHPLYLKSDLKPQKFTAPNCRIV